jgi:AraC-like DNA-binding protein
MLESIFAYEVSPQSFVHHTGSGRLDLSTPIGQVKRAKPCFVSYIVLKGELSLVDYLPGGEEPFLIRSGEIHIIGPGLHQASTAPSAPGTTMIWIHFSFFEDPHVGYLATPDAAADSIYGAPLEQSSWIIPRHMQLGRDLDSVLQLCSELNDCVRLCGALSRSTHLICGHLISLLHRATTQRILKASSAKDASPSQAHVRRACNFIRLNYDKKISLSEVSEAIGLSPAYLSRCFQQSLGQSVVDFLLRTRIEAAKELLTAQSFPSVKEVAYQTGFASPIYFCRVFRKLERMSATQYINRRRNGRESE